MAAKRFLVILIQCLLLLFITDNALASKHRHHRAVKHHRVTRHKVARHSHKRGHHARHKVSRHKHVAAKPAVDTTTTIEPTAIASEPHLDSSGSSEAINPKVLSLAMHAVKKADAEGVPHRNVMAIIDYSLASTHKRMWIIDIQAQRVLSNTLVAHGRSTGDNVAQHFSNQPGSLASSVGLFVTKDTYQGHHGKSLRLQGLEPGFNSNALSRAIVIHGANYVSDGFAKSHGRLGRSWGCPAVPEHLSSSIVSQLKNGALLFAYAPDSHWLKHSKYLA